MKFISTRGQSGTVSFSEALLSGLAPDGGLFVPQDWPSVSQDIIASLKDKSYVEHAKVILPIFMGEDIAGLDSIIEDNFDTNNAACQFHGADIAPIKTLSDNMHVMELFHGPTLSFKDYALQLAGRLFDHVLEREGRSITILTATSGDTGSAAIEACRHCDNVRIFVLYPHGRVSEVQRRQMVCVDAPNVHNIALEGSFDDCQNVVKALFNDKDFKAQHNLSAMNSINWARINAQIVYYAYACSQFDEPVNFVVPTGNFGNIFAGYIARAMGFPIKKLIVATNSNDILTRFFETAEMRMAGVQQTLSPSMDIEISSNFERLLFDLFDRDSDMLRKTMQQFKAQGLFALPQKVFAKARSIFDAGRCDDTQILSTIKRTYEAHNYIIDPHTATGVHVAQEHRAKIEGPMVVLGTADPAKFPDAVEKSIGMRPPLPDFLDDLFDRHEVYDILANDEQTIRNHIKKYTS